MKRNTFANKLAAAGAALLMAGGLAAAGEAQDVDRNGDDRSGLQQALTAGQGADRVEIDMNQGDRGALEQALTFGAGADRDEIDMDQGSRGALDRALTAGAGGDFEEIQFVRYRRLLCAGTRVLAPVVGRAYPVVAGARCGD